MTIKMKMAVLVLSALVGISGLTWLSQSQITKVYEKANYGNENTIPSLVALNDAINMVATVRVLSWQHISQTEKSRRKELEDKIQSMRRKIDEALLKYEPLLSNEKDRSLLAADRSVLSEYDDLRDKVISLSNAGKNDEARDLLMANQKILTKLVDTFNDHGKFNIDLSAQAVTVASETRQSAAAFSLALAAVTLLLIAGIGFMVSKSLLVQLGGDPTLAVNIANRIAVGDLSSEIFSQQGDTGSIFAALKRISTAVQALIKDSEILTRAAVEGKLSTRADATKHQGEYRKIVEGVNQTLDSVIGPLNVAADYVDKISRGAIPQKINDTYNGDFNTIKNNLNRCIDNVNAMVADAGMLARAAVEGKLSTRADATKHEGDFRKIVEGVNQTLDSVIGPLNVAADYVDKISRGAIPQKITDTYNGDFNTIKNNLNRCIDNVNAMVADAGMLARAAVEGKLSTRADATKHEGDFRKIVEGVNQTLDSVIGPLNVAADYVDKISRGAIPQKITDTYNGDFNTIKNNLNRCIDNVNAMVADAGILAKAAVEGKLSTRADATKHEGDFRKIVEGVNQTLDSVIGPLNVAADYVDKISRGAIPQKITDTYNGDFNTIKNNLNAAIENVNALVADAGMLAKAAVEGKLSTRADATKHQGDYRKIVEGVNQTLDSVIGPLNVAADYVDKISRGAIPQKISDTYNGDFNTIKNNLNRCIDNVNAMVADAGMLARAAVEGKLSTRADATKHEGDFRKIVEGVNQTLDSVIGPLNVAADYVDKISKGAIPSKITDTYNGDFNTIKNNLNRCIDNVNAMVADAGMLARAAVEGKLSTRADATKHEGDFRKIVEGVNQTLDSVIGPLNVAADYVDKISRGAIPQKITDTYNGDFNTIKNNLNRCIDNVNAMVADAGMLARAAVEGKLSTRADATKHEGDFRKIVEGVNQTLDSVIGPLNVAADYVDKISKGAIPPKITDTYNGDFNTIKNNLNSAIENVNALVADANLLSKAAVEGKLATRADATKHQGDYRKIVEGVNQTLDSVIGPLNVAADYVDKISKGSTPPRITDTYNGDFNTIKNNLNAAIDGINQQTQAAIAISEGNFSVAVNVRSENDNLSKSLITVMQVLQGLQQELQRLTDASKAGKLEERADVNQFKGAYSEVLKGVNAMLDAILIPIGEGNRVLRLIRGGNLREKMEIECSGDHQKMKDAVNGVHSWLSDLVNYVTKIANGDLTASMQKASDQDQIHEWLILMKNNIAALVADANLLSKAAVEGKLATRADATKHQGDYRKIVEGVNQTLDSVIGPLNVAADYVDKISRGAIPPKITDTYNGDFNTIKNNLNAAIENVNALVADAVMLSKAAVEGKLATRADASKHQGDYRKIVEGVNQTLDSVIGPLNVAADYVDKISKGAIPPKITDTYNGDFNTIKNNLNAAIENVNALVADAVMLSKAAVEGKLATRADASKHQGDYRKIVEGVNETLDAVIGPLNVAADYVDKISKGAIPQKITDTYNGDFNTIKNNLNAAIENVNALVADAGMLAKAAVEGKLSTRADATKHQGDYRKIVEGVNQTLDSVIGPLNVAADYVDKISKGNMPSKITDTYNGDFNTIKNNLNRCIDNINAMVNDANMLSNAAIEGKLTTRADAAKHEGDFKKIVEGVNQTLDAVIEPVQETASVLYEMAKGNLQKSVVGKYRGDHAQLANALNTTLGMVKEKISEISKVLNAVAKGDLTVRLESEYVGDYVEIRVSLLTIVDSMKQIVGDLKGVTSQVSNTSEQLDSLSQALSQGANMQAANLEESSASIEELLASVMQNAQNAKATDQIANTS